MKVKKDKVAKKSVAKVAEKSKAVKKPKNPVVAVITEDKPEEKPIVAKKESSTPKKKLSVKERKEAKKAKLKAKKESLKTKNATSKGTGSLPPPDKVDRQKKKKKTFVENRPEEGKLVEVNTDHDPSIKVELPERLVTKDVVKKAVAACKTAISLEQQKKKNLFSDELKIALHIAYMKIPKCPSRSARV
jgi:hypothetical protein